MPRRRVNIKVVVFLFDEENEQKLAKGDRPPPSQVDQVLDNPHVIIRNRKNRRGTYLIIGVDNGNRCIAVPIESTPQRGLWRPVTAWFCKPGEIAVLRRVE